VTISPMNERRWTTACKALQRLSLGKTMPAVMDIFCAQGKNWRGRGGVRRGGSLLVLGVFLVGGCASPQQKAARHRAEADHWAAEGKIGEATVEYRRAIQLDPKSSAARISLAKIFMDRQAYPSAYQQLVSVRKNDPQLYEGQLMMADLMLKTGDFAKAEAGAQALISQNSNDTAALMILAESAMATKNAQLARTTTDHVLQVDPGNGRAWYLRSIFQLFDHQNPEAEASLRKAIEFSPDYVQPVVVLGALMQQRGDIAGAQTMIEQALARNPKNIQLLYLMADFRLSQNQRPQAEELVREITVLDDTDSTNRGALARFYATTGNSSGAEQEYRAILKKHPDDVQNGLRLAQLYLDQGRSSEADQLVEQAAKKSPDNPKILLFRGGLRIEQGKLDDGVRDLQRVVQLQPDWPLPQYLLGLAYVRQGKLDLAQGALNGAAELDPNLALPHIILAQLALNQGKPEAAIAAIEKTLEQKPQTVQPYLIRSAALAEEGRFGDAEKSTLPLVDEFPEPPARAMTYRILAWAKFQQKRYEEAYKFAKESLKYDASSQEGLYLIGATQIGMNRPDAGLAEVTKYVQATPDSAPGYEVLGQLQAITGHSSDAEASFQKAISMDPNLISAQLRLSDLELSEGKLNEAFNLLAKLAQAQPQLAAPEVRMGQISEMRQDWKAADLEYNKALALEPGNLIAENNLAWLYAEHGGNIDIALRLAQNAKEAAPQSATVSDTLAWILIHKQSYGTAIELLQNCVRDDPDNAAFSYHLGVAYYRAGRKSEAAKSLQTALKLGSNFPNANDAKEMLATLSK